MKIYRIFAMIASKGDIEITMNEFDCTENKKTFTVTLDEFGGTCLIKKEHLNSIQTHFYEDKINIARYFVWTLNPSGVDELLTNKILEQVKIRLEYAELIKHLWNK